MPRQPLENEMSFERKAVCKLTQFKNYESEDAYIQRDEILECVEADKDVIELAIDIQPGRMRTYIRMSRSDLLSMIEVKS